MKVFEIKLKQKAFKDRKKSLRIFLKVFFDLEHRIPTGKMYPKM